MEGRALTAAFVRNVGGTGKARRYGDGNGLYLLVKPGGRKSWVQRIVVQGVRRDLGLGSANLVTLKEARQLAHENRRLARAGEDPQAPRNVASPSFADALESVIGMHAATWKEGGRTADQWRASMARYVLPRLGRKGVHAVSTADIMAVLSPIWVEKHETARRIRRRIGAVMNWAMAQGYRPDNPAGEYVVAALPKVGRVVEHQRALPYSEVGTAVAKVRASKASPGARLAFEFMVLCAVRSSEARLARWDEIDLGAREWQIPAERMKGKRGHRVPLADRTLVVLNEAQSLRQGEPVFPSSVRGRAIASGTLVKLLQGLAIDAVPHGFRSSFRDWASERTDTPHAVMEAALAHVVTGQTEAAYARSDLFDRRRTLMQAWADYLGASA